MNRFIEYSKDLLKSAIDKSSYRFPPDDMSQLSDIDQMFHFIGMYICSFNFIESRLDQIILLGLGYDSWDATQLKLAKLKFFQKVNECENLINQASCYKRARVDKDWMAHFKSFTINIVEESKRRNSLVHAYILSDGADHGYPHLKVDRVRKDGGYAWNTEAFNQSFMAERAKSILNLSVDANFIYLKLIYFHQ